VHVIIYIYIYIYIYTPTFGVSKLRTAD
jgi:hypothetical protein